MPNITTEQYIGASVTADESAILGYMTGRPIADHALRIGDHSYIRAGSIIYGGVTIGSHFQSGHNVTIREETTIGDHVGIWSNTVVDYGCQIGSNVKIHTNVYIAQFTIIEDEVFMAPGVSIANDMRPLCTLCTQNGGPTIKRGARLGVNVTVLPGVTIGEYALIGAGTVVTKDVPAGAVVVGNPGRVVKQLDELGCPTDPDNCQGYVNMMDRNTQIKMGLNGQ